MDQSFAALKQGFTMGPILKHPQPILPFIVEANASGEGLLSQAKDCWFERGNGSLMVKTLSF